MLSLGLVTLVVSDYDQAIDFYTRVLRFDLLEDLDQGDKRWVKVGVADGAQLLLAEATSDQQRQAIGNQTGGRVGFFLQTDDFDGQYQHMQTNGVKFLENPRNEAYGRVVVFADLYGNKWDLIQPT